MEQFDAEIEELRRQETEDELMFGEEPEWTRKAVNAVNEAKERVKGIGDPPVPKQPTEKKPKRQPIQFTSLDEESPEMYYLQHTSKSGLNLPDGVSTPTIEPERDQPTPPADSSTPHPEPRNNLPVRKIGEPKGSYSGHLYFLITYRTMSQVQFPYQNRNY